MNGEMILKATTIPTSHEEKAWLLADKLKACFYTVYKISPNAWAAQYAKEGLELLEHNWRDRMKLRSVAMRVLANLKVVNSAELQGTKAMLSKLSDELGKEVARHGKN